MIYKLKAPPKCALALGGLAGVLLLVGLVLVWPWWFQNRIYNGQMDGRAAQLARFRSVAAQQPEVGAALARVQRSAQQTRYYISANTTALGAAELQKLVRRITDAHNGKLTSTQALPVEDDGNTVRISIRVHMKLEPRSLAEVLHGLEGGRPLLFVENLSIRSQKRGGRRTRGKKAAAPVHYMLDIRCDLVGYMKDAAG